MCNTTSADRPIRSAHPHIHVRLHDLIGRERENRDNANPGGGVCPVDFDMRLTDENAVRFVHPSPKLNPNFSEPDYGPSSQWNVSYFFQPAPGPVAFYLAMTMTYQTQTQTMQQPQPQPQYALGNPPPTRQAARLTCTTLAPRLVPYASFCLL